MNYTKHKKKDLNKNKPCMSYLSLLINLHGKRHGLSYYQLLAVQFGWLKRERLLQ